MAVLPSEDSETETPCWAGPIAPVPTSLFPCWVQTAAAAPVDPRRPCAAVVVKPADDGRVAVGGQRDGDALLGGSNRSCADQLVSLLGPDTAAARVDPRSPLPAVVVRPADDGRVAVGGQRDGDALLGGSNRSRADQLVSLLGPDTAAARVDPRRPVAASVVAGPANDGRVAIGGQRDGDALLGGSTRSVPTSFGPCCENWGISPHYPVNSDQRES